MKKITEFKIKVTPEQSEIVQKRMIINGEYKWAHDFSGKIVNYTHVQFLYFYSYGDVKYGERLSTFNNHDLPELTFAEWERIYMPKDRRFKQGGYLPDLEPLLRPGEYFVPKPQDYIKETIGILKKINEIYNELVDIKAAQVRYKELQKPKSKEQQLYEYFADNHDIQLMSTDIQEIERIFKDLCQCENRTSFISNLCEECKKYIY